MQRKPQPAFDRFNEKPAFRGDRFSEGGDRFGGERRPRFSNDRFEDRGSRFGGDRFDRGDRFGGDRGGRFADRGERSGVILPAFSAARSQTGRCRLPPRR